MERPPRSSTKYLAPSGRDAICFAPSFCVLISTGILRQYKDAASGSRANES